MDKEKVDQIMYQLAVGVVVSLFIITVMLFFFSVPEKNVSALNMFFGALSAAFSTVVGYFFGSSQGSKDKTAALAAQAEAAAAEVK